MRCELDGAATSGGADDAGIEQDYDEDADTDDADCTTLLNPAGLDACATTDTTE